MSSQKPETAPDAAPAASGWLALFPALFVFFWATGFIGGKLGLRDAGPFTFLTLRFAIVVVLLTALALVTRAPWPRREALWRLAVGGVLLHAGYLGLLFVGMKSGVEAGVSAVIAGLQPLLTAAIAGPFLGEKVSRRQWLGLVLGLAGVALVAQAKLAQGLGTPAGMIFAFMGMTSLTFGTLWQRRHGGQMDLRTGSVVQFAAATLACLPFAIVLENFEHTWTRDFTLSMAWLVVVLSVGTIAILFTLIRRGAASKVASLFFLVPPTTALIAWYWFGEKLGPLAFAGMVLVVIAVAMVTIAPKQEKA